MDARISLLKEEFENSLKNVQDLDKLNVLYVDFFGKKGKFNQTLKEILSSSSDKKSAGESINLLKSELTALYEKRKLSLLNEESVDVDVTAPGKKHPLGHEHVVTLAIEEIAEIFTRIGFVRKSYREIEKDWYAFEALNMPKDHPARDEWETFFVSDNVVLTPHTSSGQIRELEKKELPIRMINIAKTYRRQIDISHIPMFHQFEGMLVDKDVTIGHLKGTLDYFVQQFFGPNRKTRLRPFHFQFTEPSFEVDITCGNCLGRGCRMCKAGWVELGGAGMIHPNVLKATGVDPRVYNGFAFGWGVERTIVMRTSISDLRLLYQNDLRFLEQF